MRGGARGAGPDPPLLSATREDGGWRLDGHAPLVTGWGLIDLVQVAVRDVATADAPDEEAGIVTALLDARAAPGLTARPLALLAADASRTVALRFDGVHLPDELVSGQTTRVGVPRGHDGIGAGERRAWRWAWPGGACA